MAHSYSHNRGDLGGLADRHRSGFYETPEPRKTSADRLYDAVIKHRIMWNDLSERVAKNEGIPFYEGANLVAVLIEHRSCSLPVAVALIDLIVEKGLANGTHR